MHFPTILVTLAAAVSTTSAINVRSHSGNTCNGEWSQCSNIAIAYTARIRGEAYRDSGCSTFAGSELSRGADWICIPYTSARPGRRTGGRWYNSSTRRRSVGALEGDDDNKTCPAEQYVEEGECRTNVKPDLFGLADGTTFNITGLDEDKVMELEKLAGTGTAIDAMPAEFQALRSSEE
ncbi:hypothetical protein MCOR19_011406 [Pyricularia oryzae]|nr:hypothetical protein MCOR19_011406 [Pyricularia oryzae]KAI6459058.1 hypothetical protein MCOR15_006073 [Pyricularia oryzae]KAI6473636.1 hypothetical protein MCOR18_008167 [Pyricularia oryzae]KAI6527620.1 hypothetical protein MCOR16_005688 [Pyricularia oryzae]